MLEIEAKIKLKNREELLSKGDLKKKSENHILDIYFDKNNEFASSDKVLRLRKHNDKAYIAYKGPRIKDSNLHVRNEYELEISDYEQMKKIIELLEFSPTQITEKIRETFHLKGHELKIELDYYPFIGFYLELEGERDEVLKIMKMFGFKMKEATTKNCTELFFEYLKRENIKLSNPNLQFTFKDETKKNS